MHLKYYLSIPYLIYKGSNIGVRDIVELLNNLFHHQLFYSQLEDWGYNPRIAECGAVNKLLHVLKNVDLDRVDKEPILKAKFAIVYTRFSTFCTSENNTNSFNDFYCEPRLVEAKEIAAKLAFHVSSFKNNESLEFYKKVLNECCTIIKLPTKYSIHARCSICLNIQT